MHLVAKLPSLYNVVFHRSNSLCSAASKCPSSLVRVIFRDSAAVSYYFCGYNSLFGSTHLKVYDSQSEVCATVIRSIRCSCTDHTFDEMIDSLMRLILSLCITCTYLLHLFVGVSYLIIIIIIINYHTYQYNAHVHT